MSQTQSIQREDQYQVLPGLSVEEYEALKADIEENGVRDAIIVDENGQIIDGHHRQQICDELGIDPPTRTVEHLSEQEKRDLAYASNLQRRHLEHGQKREMVEQYLLEDWDGDNSNGWYEEVANTLGVGAGTVQNVFTELKESGKLSQIGLFSKEEKRQQVRDYIDEHPDATNREVADAIEADVSHPTVGNWREEFQDDDSDGEWFHTNRCRAVTKTSGVQCDSRMTPLCGNHKDARNLVCVDDFEEAPNEDLRDELIEHCDINGQRAFQLAILADDIQELWQLVTGLQDVRVGDREWSGSKLAGWADDIAEHPDLKVDWEHPLAAKNCIAITGSDEQCPNGSYCTKLLCGMHEDVDDPDTILERDGVLDELTSVFVDGHKHWVLERRGDDWIVITPDWELERVGQDRVVDVDTSGQESEQTSTTESGPADSEEPDPDWDAIEAAPARPPMLQGLNEGDSVAVRLEDGTIVEGSINDTGEGGWDVPEGEAEFEIFVEPDDDTVRDSLIVSAHRDRHGEWGPVTATDLEFLADDPDESHIDLGEVAEVSGPGEDLDMRPEQDVGAGADDSADGVNQRSEGSDGEVLVNDEGDGPGYSGLKSPSDAFDLTIQDLEEKGIPPEQATILADQFDSWDDLQDADLEEIDAIHPTTATIVDRASRDGVAVFEGAFAAASERHDLDPTQPFFDQFLEAFVEHREAPSGDEYDIPTVEDLGIGGDTADPAAIGAASPIESIVDAAADELDHCSETLKNLKVLLDRTAADLEDGDIESALTKIDDARDEITAVIDDV